MSNRHTLSRIEFRFREHEQEFATLLNESAGQAGRSPSDHARELIKLALTEYEQLQHHLFTLQNDVAELRHQVQKTLEMKDGIGSVFDNINALRDELATFVVRILAHAGQMRSADAKKWVEEVLDAEQPTKS